MLIKQKNENEKFTALQWDLVAWRETSDKRFE